jgi:hypothetical protein
VDTSKRTACRPVPSAGKVSGWISVCFTALTLINANLMYFFKPEVLKYRAVIGHMVQKVGHAVITGRLPGSGSAHEGGAAGGGGKWAMKDDLSVTTFPSAATVRLHLETVHELHLAFRVFDAMHHPRSWKGGRCRSEVSEPMFIVHPVVELECRVVRGSDIG